MKKILLMFAVVLNLSAAEKSLVKYTFGVETDSSNGAWTMHTIELREEKSSKVVHVVSPQSNDGTSLPTLPDIQEKKLRRGEYRALYLLYKQLEKAKLSKKELGISGSVCAQYASKAERSESLEVLRTLYNKDVVQVNGENVYYPQVVEPLQVPRLHEILSARGCWTSSEIFPHEEKDQLAAAKLQKLLKKHFGK